MICVLIFPSFYCTVSTFYFSHFPIQPYQLSRPFNHSLVRRNLAGLRRHSFISSQVISSGILSSYLKKANSDNKTGDWKEKNIASNFLSVWKKNRLWREKKNEKEEKTKRRKRGERRKTGMTKLSSLHHLVRRNIAIESEQVLRQLPSLSLSLASTRRTKT